MPPMPVTAPAVVNRINARFAALKAAKKKAFVAYLTAGDPHLAVTEDLIPALDAAGVDIIELGVPYSDPMADGPAIQLACDRALASGTTLVKVLDSLTRIRTRSQVPVLLFTYLSPILAYGVAKFAADAVAAGADGVLLLDLPPEEDPALLDTLRAAGLATVCLAAPTTPTGRKAMLAKASRGFLYYVCRLGVTGERSELPEDLGLQVSRLKKASPTTPVCIGFGISTPEQAAAAAAHGDGVVVGSHLVKILEKHGQEADVVARVARRAGELAAAVHAV